MKLSLLIVGYILVMALGQTYLGQHVDPWYVFMGIVGWLCVAVLESLRRDDKRRIKALQDAALERELVFQTRLSQLDAEMDRRLKQRRFG